MSKIYFDVISLFPEAFHVLNNMGVISRAIKKKVISINTYNLRDYGEGSYKQVDDLPYGGGAGMVLKPEPIYKAYESIKKSKTVIKEDNKCPDFLELSPLGQMNSVRKYNTDNMKEEGGGGVESVLSTDASPSSERTSLLKKRIRRKFSS